MQAMAFPKVRMLFDRDRKKQQECMQQELSRQVKRFEKVEVQKRLLAES